MENKEAWENYKEYSSDITEHSRNLAFAGIAIIWVLKPENGAFSSYSLLSLSLIIAYFLADVAQYLVAAERWRRWIDSKEEEIYENTGGLEGDYSPPVSLDKPARYLFWSKVVFLAGGFLFLGREIFSRFG